jgi:hypothetical protein
MNVDASVFEPVFAFFEAICYTMQMSTNFSFTSAQFSMNWCSQYSQNTMVSHLLENSTTELILIYTHSLNYTHFGSLKKPRYAKIVLVGLY